MPSPQQKRKAKRREEYLLNRDYELESSQVGYNAGAEQRRASARDMYRASKRQTIQRQHAITEIQLPPKGELCMEYYGLACFL